MPRFEQDERLLDRYVRQELTPKEEEQFNQRMQDDDFRQALQWHQDLQAAAQQRGRQHLKEQLQSWENKESKTSAQKRSRSNFWRWSLIAIAVVATLLLLWLFFRPSPKSPEEIFAEHFMPYPNIVAPIEKSEGQVSERTLAFEAYELTAYPQAEVQFAQLEQTLTVQFYRGVTALAQEQPAKAITFLQPVSETENRFQQAAAWYLALAHLLQNELEIATNLLENIQNTSDHPFQQRAANLLQEL